MNAQNEYIPGTCNIGPKQIAIRKRASIYAALMCVFVITSMYVLDVNKYYRLFLFFPATIFAVTFQQWYFKFCVYFGLKGVFNFGDMGSTFSVNQKDNYKKDRIKVVKMILLGIAFGLVASVLFFLVP